MKDNISGLHKLTMKDRDAATSVLARAFSEYELLRYYFPDKQHRHRIARTFCFVEISVCLKFGEVYASSESMEGVAGWMPPGTAPFGGREVFRSVPFWVLLNYAFQGASRMLSYDRYLTDIHHRLIPEPHWYLSILGVDPSFQGKGISSRLIRPMLERIDAEQLPAFVETHALKNTGIYGRFGFELASEMKIPGTELTSYAMIRKSIPK